MSMARCVASRTTPRGTASVFRRLAQSRRRRRGWGRGLALQGLYAGTPSGKGSPEGPLGQDLSDTILTAEPLIRIGTFLSVLVVMALWELLAPRRAQAIGRPLRWPNNLGVVVVDTLVVRLLFPTATVGLALVGESRGW